MMGEEFSSGKEMMGQGAKTVLGEKRSEDFFERKNGREFFLNEERKREAKCFN